MTATPSRWTIRADRRTCDYDAIVEEFVALDDTLVGLRVEIVPRKDFEADADTGTFRDFIPIARAEADNVAILETLAEELLIEFGFEVDVLRT